MDFELSEDQQALRDLVRQILEREVTLDRLKAIEAAGEGVDDALWSTLTEANLLGLAVPEAFGGMGLGLLELCVLLEEVGRAVAPVPVLPALVLGGLPLARFGSAAQQERWLPALARGEVLLSAALEDAGSASPTRPATRARRDGEGFRLSGRKRCVSLAGRAARVLVPAATDAGVGIFLVDPSSAGVRLEAGLTSLQQPLFELALDDAPVPADALLGEDPRGGDRVAAWLHDCATVATCALQLCVSERALEITTGYVKEREQFGAPIGSFPAVQQRAADAWIDLQAMRWTTWRAAWLLAEELPAGREAAVAKFWAADAGSRIADTAQHLHGGTGADLDYPIHRYFLWSKALELAGGGATPQLARLGAEMARSQPQEPA